MSRKGALESASGQHQGAYAVPSATTLTSRDKGLGGVYVLMRCGGLRADRRPGKAPQAARCPQLYVGLKRVSKR